MKSPNFDSATQARFDACRSTQRELVYPGQVFQVFQLVLDEPETTLQLQAVKLAADFLDGVSVLFATSHGQTVSVGHAPVEVAPSVFMWVALDMQVKYTEHKGTWSLAFPVIIKTRHNLLHTAAPNTNYLLTHKAYIKSYE